MVLSIDESDKKRFFSMEENESSTTKSPAIPMAMDIGKRKVVFREKFCLVEFMLEPSDVMELYTQAPAPKPAEPSKVQMRSTQNEPNLNEQQLHIEEHHPETEQKSNHEQQVGEKVDSSVARESSNNGIENARS